MTTNAYQRAPILGQQKAKEFSCHTPLTKDEKSQTRRRKIEVGHCRSWNSMPPDEKIIAGENHNERSEKDAFQN
jgi:hypothetical protein